MTNNPIFYHTDIPDGATHYVVTDSFEKRGRTSIHLAWFKCVDDEWLRYITSEYGEYHYWYPLESPDIKDAWIKELQPIELAPAATDTGLVSNCDGKEQEAFETWAKSKRYDMHEHPLHYLFLDPKTNAAREGWNEAIRYCHSQADELLAAKGEECKDIEATLSAWFDTKKITEDSLKPLMVAAVKGYLRTCSSGGMPQELIDEVLPAVECMIDYGVFTESVTQYTMSLKADNAAQAARIKELEEGKRILSTLCEEGFEREKALEAKLAAAHKALEPFADHANDRAVDDTGWRDKETVKIVVSIGDLRKARAVLGGKPSC